MNWFERLFDPEQSPSSTTLICLLAGISGIIIAIISSFIDVPNGVDVSKFLVITGVGGKVAQHLTGKKGE